MSYPGGCQCHISIHSLRVEGDAEREKAEREKAISIHSLRVEGDIMAEATETAPAISIHSLRVEGDADKR